MPLPKAPGTSWKQELKEFKSQRAERNVENVIFLTGHAVKLMNSAAVVTCSRSSRSQLLAQIRKRLMGPTPSYWPSMAAGEWGVVFFGGLSLWHCGSPKVTHTGSQKNKNQGVEVKGGRGRRRGVLGVDMIKVCLYTCAIIEEHIKTFFKKSIIGTGRAL